MKNNEFFLVMGFFLIFYLINPDTFIPVFAAIIVGTEEEDELKGTNKKVASLDQKKESNEERVKLFWRSASDYINGGEGRDIIEGNSGKDELYGESGSNRIEGNNGIDYIDGYTGNDLIQGNSGKDNILGYIGDDILHGKKVDDIM